MSYKIPRGYLDKNTVSAEMPRTQAVTRAAPPMRTAVLRDPSKYMLKYVPYTDPSAVANVEMAKGKIGQAFAAGMIELGKTFDAADASSQYTTAWNSFQLEAHGQLSILKDQGLTRPKQTYSGGQLVTDDDPTHVQMQATLHKGLLQQRDRWAKTIKDPKARAQFLQNSVATVVSLQKQAGEYARKKHVMYLQGESFKHFETALTVEDVYKVASMPHMKLIWTPTELNKKVNDRITAIVFEKNRVEILKIANKPALNEQDERSVDAIRMRLMMGGHDATAHTDTEGNIYYQDHLSEDGKRYDERTFIPHKNAQYLGKAERDTLFDLLDAAEKKITDEVEEGVTKDFNNTAIAIYQNTETWTTDKITKKANDAGWDATQLKTALGLRKAALEGPTESNTALKLAILENIETWDFKTILDSAHLLTRDDLNWALRRRDGFDNKVDQWYDKGDGKTAMDTLKMIHGVDTETFTFSMPGMATQAQKAKAKYLEARVRLEARIQDESTDPREQGKLAWGIVKEMRREWLESKDKRTPADVTDANEASTTDNDTGTGANGGVTATAVSDSSGIAVTPENQIHAYRWATDNRTADGTPITARVAATLPADYPGRASIIAMYEYWGASFSETERVGVTEAPAVMNWDVFLMDHGPDLANRPTVSGGHSIAVTETVVTGQPTEVTPVDELTIDNYTLSGPNAEERTLELFDLGAARGELHELHKGGGATFRRSSDGRLMNMTEYEAYLKEIGYL